MLFYVAGITGKVGGAAARQLLADGHSVRALVRDRSKAGEWIDRGVDVRVGAWEDATALTAALTAVDGAHVMVPPCVTPQPGYPESKVVIDAIRTAVLEAKPPRVTVLSSIGSEQTSGLGLITATHMLEEALSDVTAPVAFVRAGSFIENGLGGLQTARESGLYYSFYAPVDRPVPSIATEDIGKEVAKLLESGWAGRKIVELGTPMTPEEMAQGMSTALGRDVKAQAIPRDRWAATFEGFGMPKGTSWAYEEMLEGVNSGHIHFGVAGTEPVAATLTAADVFGRAK